jgi:hypothetical protein
VKIEIEIETANVGDDAVIEESVLEAPGFHAQARRGAIECRAGRRALSLVGRRFWASPPPRAAPLSQGRFPAA